MAIILLSALLCNSCSHTVSSIASINTNTFQSAENLKAGDFKFHSSYSAAPTYFSTTEIENDDLDTFYFYTDFPVKSYVYGGAFQLGVTDRLDVILDASRNFFPGQTSPCGKLYLKYQLGSQTSPYSISAMPGFGIVIGTKEKSCFNDDFIEIESGLSVTEFHFLMSRRYSEETVFTLGPWITLMNHEFVTTGTVGAISWDENIRESSIYPGISLGLQHNKIMFESALMFVGDQIFLVYGIGLRF
ncbi:MAG: hypothetical protein P9L92_11420 [Candidatus Electryonea clarkiae]|nr:hypothetical protein [Candidatus Electryonea clarkiae]MDP8286420.1 hypothetical protein [Candidatus Electryonea clarkiae]